MSLELSVTYLLGSYRVRPTTSPMVSPFFICGARTLACRVGTHADAWLSLAPLKQLPPASYRSWFLPSLCARSCRIRGCWPPELPSSSTLCPACSTPSTESPPILACRGPSVQAWHEALRRASRTQCETRSLPADGTRPCSVVIWQFSPNPNFRVADDTAGAFGMTGARVPSLLIGFRNLRTIFRVQHPETRQKEFIPPGEPVPPLARH